MPTKTYIYDKPTNQWLRSGMSSIPVGPVEPTDPPGEPDDALFRPVSYATLAEARTALNAPADANYVTWNNSWTHLEQAFAALSANDILVLPERAEPYWIDSSNGFMAAGVKEVDGTDENGVKDGSRVPIVSNPRLWFSMARARRGILGMGPGVVIAPTDSGFTAPRQPLIGSDFQAAARYMLDGTVGYMVGGQEKMIEVDHSHPFFGNFTLQGRDFGGIGYSALSSGNSTHTVIKRIFFDGCWRGFAGVPNGEKAGVGLLNGTYLIENCDFVSNEGSSPVMWNRNTGGTVRNVRSTPPNHGMWTFWKCGGVNTFENVWIDAISPGMNLEENLAGFTLNWTGGKMHLHNTTGSRFHFGINPLEGSNKLHFNNVDFSPNGWTANHVSVNVYVTGGVQRRSDVTSSNGTLPISHLPESRWID